MSTGKCATPAEESKLVIADVPETETRNRLLATRLKEVRLLLGKTQEEMATLLALSARSWQDYEAGKTVPNGRTYAELCAMGFRSEWLLGRDTGPPRYANESDATAVALPKYENDGGGGPSESLRFRVDWLRAELRVDPSRLVVVIANGDSMSPTIESGDVLLVDTSANGVPGDGLYVMSIEGVVIVKRIARRASGAVVVTSDNPLYRHSAEELPRAEAAKLHIIGRVVWAGGRM